MGGCASKPKDLEKKTASAPIEAPAVAAAEKVETVSQEKTDVVEEEPLVDVSEAAPEAPKIDLETKEEVVPAEATESKQTESEAKVVEEEKNSEAAA